MNAETTQITETLSIDGPIGIAPTVVIGVVLAVAFGWILWSQRRATGPGWAGIFWVLRVVAISLVLGMLLGPGWITLRRTTTPQSVAFLVDISDSMDVTDLPVGSRQIRWNLSAATGLADDTPLAEFDRASVCIHMASRRSHDARQAVQRHQASKEVRRMFESVGEAIRRGVNHLEAGLMRLPDADMTSRTQRVLSTLQGQIAHDFRDLVDSLDQATAPSADDLSETLLAAEDSLDTLSRRLRELTRDMERTATDHGAASFADGNEVLTRREQVARTLNAVQQAASEQTEQSVSIQPIRFDRQAALVSLDTGWDDIMQASKPDPRAIAAESNDFEPARTDISAALDYLGQTAAAESIRSVILITDGAHNAAGELTPQEIAATLGDIPVHVVPIGNASIRKDLLLHRVDAPTAVVEEDLILIDIIVTAFQCAGETSTLILRKNGKEIDQQTLAFSKDRTDRRTFFQVPADERGAYEFELSLEPLEDESNTTNNIASFTVNVIQDTLRILLADRISRWEYRYLEQLFRRDESITYDKLLFHPEIRATGYAAEIGGLPDSIDGWSHYDVVILGDMETKHLSKTSQQTLDDFVRKRGGHLIVIAGKQSMPHKFDQQILLDLLPVEKGRPLTSTEGLVIDLTPFGKAHPALTISDTAEQSEQVWKKQFDNLPLYSVSEYSRPRLTAETLIAATSDGRIVSVEAGAAQSPDHALLCWHQAGAGRVMYLSAPATYRLRYRLGDRHHHRFWGQMLRWLTASERGIGTQTVRIMTDSIRYDAGGSVGVTVRVSDQKGDPVVGATIAATATPQDGPEISVDLTGDEKVPGRYIGSLSGLSTGSYRITPTGNLIDELLPLAEDKELTEARITVAASDSPEQVNTRCNITLLRQIAEITGGQVVPPTAIGEILTLSTLAQEVSERVERQPLWNRWSLLVIAFLCLCTEWIVRKRLGLV